MADNFKEMAKLTGKKLHSNPSSLGEDVKRKIIILLNSNLADGLDLQGQFKVAHWNVKGPYFPYLHSLFEDIYSSLAGTTDKIAERAITLGGTAYGTSKHVATHSRIENYPQDTSEGLEHVKLLSDRVGKFIFGLKQSRDVSKEIGDFDTENMLTDMVLAFEKHGWFLRAILDK